MEEEDDFDDPMTPISVKGRNKIDQFALAMKSFVDASFNIVQWLLLFCEGVRPKLPGQF